MDEGSNGGSLGPSSGQPGQLTGHDHLSRLLHDSNSKQKLKINSDNLAQRAKDNNNSANLARQSTRNWKPGDIYAPHDLSPQEMRKWKAPKQPTKDIIDMLGLNPLDHYRVRRYHLWAWKPASPRVYRSHCEVDGSQSAQPGA